MKKTILPIVGLCGLLFLVFSFQNCAEPLSTGSSSNSSSTNDDGNSSNTYFSDAARNSSMFSQGKTVIWARGTGSATHTHNVRFIYPATIEVSSTSNNPNTNPQSGSILKSYSLDQLVQGGCQKDLIKEGSTVSAPTRNFKTYILACFNDNKFSIAHTSAFPDEPDRENRIQNHFIYDTIENNFIEHGTYTGSGNGVWNHYIHQNVVTGDLKIYSDLTNANQNPNYNTSLHYLNINANGCQNKSFKSGTIISSGVSLDLELQYCLSNNELSITHVSTIDGDLRDPSPVHMVYAF